MILGRRPASRQCQFAALPTDNRWRRIEIGGAHCAPPIFQTVNKAYAGEDRRALLAMTREKFCHCEEQRDAAIFPCPRRFAMLGNETAEYAEGTMSAQRIRDHVK